MLLPRMESESSGVVSLFLVTNLTVLRCVFICMSTPVVEKKKKER